MIINNDIVNFLSKYQLDRLYQEVLSLEEKILLSKTDTFSKYDILPSNLEKFISYSLERYLVENLIHDKTILCELGLENISINEIRSMATNNKDN